MVAFTVDNETSNSMTINSYIDGRALEAGSASTFTGDFSDV